MDRWAYERCAHSIAVRQRGEPGDVAPQCVGDGLGLGVAELGKLPRCIDDRAMVLTELVLTGCKRTRLGCEPCGVEALDNRGDGLTVTSDDRPRTARGELGNGLPSLCLRQESQGGKSEIVIGLIACRASFRCQGEDLARAPATTPRPGPIRRFIRRLDETGGDQRGQWPSHGRGRHSEP